MDAQILCTLLAQRLDPEYHRLSGLEVVWLNEDKVPDENSFYDTPENRAIVADVIANYDTLAAAYLESLKPIYADLRRAEYPPVADYLDGIVKGDQLQIDKYIADCLAVKAKYPKT